MHEKSYKVITAVHLGNRVEIPHKYQQPDPEVYGTWKFPNLDADEVKWLLNQQETLDAHNCKFYDHGNGLYTLVCAIESAEDVAREFDLELNAAEYQQWKE